jgi:hypothetical protein
MTFDFLCKADQIVLKLAPPGSKVYASGKFVCGLLVSSLSVEGQILNIQAQGLVTPPVLRQTIRVMGAQA